MIVLDWVYSSLFRLRVCIKLLQSRHEVDDVSELHLIRTPTGIHQVSVSALVEGFRTEFTQVVEAKNRSENRTFSIVDDKFGINQKNVLPRQ